jgi:hypothetical protein
MSQASFRVRSGGSGSLCKCCAEPGHSHASQALDPHLVRSRQMREPPDGRLVAAWSVVLADEHPSEAIAADGQPLAGMATRVGSDDKQVLTPRGPPALDASTGNAPRSTRSSSAGRGAPCGKDRFPHGG